MSTEELTKQLIEQLTPELDDHIRALSEFGARLAPGREQLIAAWRGADKSEMNSRGWYENAVRVLVDALPSLNESSSLNAYLCEVAAWGRQLAASGTNYATVSRRLTACRRALLPSILELYQAGPELQLLFRALDALDCATRTIIAAAYIESAHAQLSETARARAIGRLTHGIAHSLNNSLATILGRAQLLERNMPDELVLDELREIERAVRNAADGLRRVQEYAAGREEDQPSALDVNSVVGEAAQLTRYRWRDDAEANGVVIDVIKDLADVPPVLGKRLALRDALVELIMNAVEAMPLGGLVTLRTERVGDQVRVSVTDLGEGMDAATRAAAISPFFTTKAAGHVGLGLATANAIAKQHDGGLEIDSTPGRGTTVTIAIPVSPVPPASDRVRLQAPSRGVNILVVDDDAAIREVIGRSLALRGHRVVTAESGSDALRTFREESPFEVVLCDLGMPEMNGFEVSRALKKIDPKTIVILMTGWGAELDPERFRESGIDRAVDKPFDMEHVLQSINEALALKERTEV
jgi:signal transduction histidine kinase/ActR/RegA family two-component response regulator